MNCADTIRVTVWRLRDEFPEKKAYELAKLVHADFPDYQYQTIRKQTQLVLREERDAQAPPEFDPGEDEEITTSGELFVNMERDFVYNAADDLYLVYLSHYPKPVMISGENIRALREAYSDEVGGRVTVNELCRTYGISRKDFIALKRSMGWTHDMLPFTEVELIERDTDDLVEDLAMRKERDVEKKWRKREWKRTIADADSWRAFRRCAWEPMVEVLGKHAPARKVKRLELTPGSRRYMVSIQPWDMHLGKLGVDGEGIEEVVSLLRRTTTGLIRDLLEFGAPEKIVLWLGSDMANSDNVHGSTSRGTPQDNGVLPFAILDALFEVSVEIIDMLRAIAPLTVRVIPGNHDHFSSWALGKGLEIAYNRVAEPSDVRVELAYMPHQAELYGANMIASTHGDGLKKGEALASVMAVNWPDLFARSTYRFMNVGHLHGLMEVDTNGVHVTRMPALSPHDRYHVSNGYFGNKRGQIAQCFDWDGGMFMRLQQLEPFTPIRYKT